MFKFRGGLFIRGAVSIFSIFGRCIRHRHSGRFQDAEAIRSDWYAVGGDIRQAAGYGK